MPNVTVDQGFPTDPKTGLTLPSSKSLDSQALAKHRAMVAVELEVMAKKMDRFGWERDRGSMAHDRLVRDWMEVLGEYPLDVVQAACRQWVRSQPGKMPNEGHILTLIQSARHQAVRDQPRRQSEPARPPRVSAERAAAILDEVGFKPRRFGS